MNQDRRERSIIDLRAELDLKTRERIHHPVVKNLYEAYVNLGIRDKLVSLVNQVPTQYQEPLIHTFSAHITKEKPTFIYILSPYDTKQDGSAKILSAAVDLLWCVSLMYDDFVDQDQERSGKKAAWIQYGQERTFGSVNAALGVIAKSINFEFGNNSYDLCRYFIDRGVSSIEEHKQLAINCTAEELISNYAKRAEFHTTFPLCLIYKGGTEKRKKALSALEDLNIAGQILNDIKDFLSEYNWNRQGFSDVRNGLVTLPIKYLWEKMDPKEQTFFKGLFGKKALREEESKFIAEAIRKTSALESASNVARVYFTSSLDTFRGIVDDSEFQYPTEWINYKLAQLPGHLLD